MSAETQIQQIIDYSQIQATTSAAAARALADDAVTAAAGGIVGGPNIPDVPSPEIPTLPVPPTPGQGQTFNTWFNDTMNQLIPQFDTRFAGFLTTYFPDVSGCIKDSSDDWICNTITNGGTGIATAVEAQIWERSRARDLVDGKRVRDQAVDAWARRGFPLPAGAMLGALADVDQGVADKVSTASRDVAIKQADIEIENVRLAVQLAVQLRTSAINAAVAYISAWAGLVGEAGRNATYRMNAEQAYYGALGSYYGAIAQVYRLPMEAAIANNRFAIDQYTVDVQALVSERAARINGAVAAARAVGAMAAAALAGQNSFASLNKNASSKE